MKILAQKQNFVLTQEGDFYAFYAVPCFACPANQCGTLEEIMDELERWKCKVNTESGKMQEMEESFLKILGGRNMSKVIKRVKLLEMPFDRWDDDKHCHVHATGCEITLEDGTVLIEYEDYSYEDAEDCIFEEEEELPEMEDEEETEEHWNLVNDWISEDIASSL